ncbi:hypothetical protein ABRP86_10370, partial [Corynebacterium sp. KPL3927]
MNRHKISPNAIVVALFGLAISGYVGIANKSILGFLILGPDPQMVDTLKPASRWGSEVPFHHA